jgi:hypothetical protein
MLPSIRSAHFRKCYLQLGLLISENHTETEKRQLREMQKTSKKSQNGKKNELQKRAINAIKDLPLRHQAILNKAAPYPP